MADQFTVGLVQTRSTNEIVPNIEQVSPMVREARKQGADLVMLPEMVSLLERSGKRMFERAQPQDKDPALRAFQDLAKQLGIWFHTGSLPIRLADDKIANRTFVLNPAGQIVATYDKIHMFDVDLDNGESYRESKAYEPGTKAVVADLPWGRLGLSICYDVRFAYLYRRLAQAGADFLAVPAAFTKVTGQAHWHVLLRARAIETGCFVFAPAQTGQHDDGRQTFGHSLVIAPWGEVLADGGEETGVVTCQIDPARVAESRGKVPALTHDRPFTID